MRLRTGDIQCLSESFTVYGWSETIGIHALAAVSNSLAAAGADRIVSGVTIEYPPHCDKACIYRMEKNIRKTCARREIELLESGYLANPMLDIPSITVYGMAEVKRSGEGESGQKENTDINENMSGKAIVLSKWVGMDGMLQAAMERREELERRFAPAFMRKVLSHRQELFADPEIRIGRDMGIPVMRQITRGGIFAALWKLSGELGCGLELELKKMPILQETVEICEYFRINPYQLVSAGCFLFVTEEAEILTETLRESQIAASVIGYTVKGSEKIIRNGEDARYIDRPAPDEIFKIFTTDNREGKQDA